MKTFSKKFYFGFRFRVVVTLTCTLLLGSKIYAGNNPSKNVKKWDVNLSLRSFYDSNILKYSDKYLERFKNHEDEGRFHINRYDDIIMQYSLGIDFTEKIIGNLNSIFSLDLGLSQYAYNPVKTWNQFEVSWRQYVYKSTSFRVSYSYIPNFYVRHFRDEEWVDVVGYVPEAFQPYSFSKDDFSFWLQHNVFEDTRVRLYFSFMKYYHNEHYTEYNCDNLLYGFRIYQDLTKEIRIDGGFKYEVSDAAGLRRSFTNDRYSSIDADNDSYIYDFGIDFELPKVFGLKNDLGLSGQLETAYYSTKNFVEVDPLHAGRIDHNYRVNIDYSVDLFSDLSVRVFYNWLYRDSRTSSEINSEEVSEEKDYTQYLAGLQFSYKFEF